MTFEDILGLVHELNTRCYEQSQEETSVAFCPFEFHSNGESWQIMYLGFPLVGDGDQLVSDEQGFPMDVPELRAFLVEETEKHLEGLRKIKL